MVGDDEADVWDDCNGDSSNSIDEEDDENEFNYSTTQSNMANSRRAQLDYNRAVYGLAIFDWVLP